MQCVPSHLSNVRGPQALQTTGKIKSAGRKEQEDKKSDERRDNGKKQQRGGKKKELSTSRLLEIMKGGKDERRTENEDISQRRQRKNKQKGERENLKVTRTDNEEGKGSGKGRGSIWKRNAGEEYGWKANHGAKANGGSCSTVGKG